MYSFYAEHYDEGQIRFSLLMYDYLLDMLKRHVPPGQEMIDLACGTGTLTVLMAEAGWHALGIDRSQEMLAVAQRKLRGFRGEGSVRFRRGDIRERHTDQPVDLVTCFYDSLNYLLQEEDLLAVFRLVEASLRPGGLWIFDMNTIYFLEHIWGEVEVEEREGYLHVMQSHFEAQDNTSTLVLTGFVQETETLYRRFDEIHVERGYDLGVINRLLVEAGLTVEGIYDCFDTQPPQPKSHRVLWVARK
jgi:ubiquinone/menaquinone biosynthesis C-methylase UbiE